VNGILIQGLRLPPFIATLGMLGVTRGIVVGTTNGQVVRPFPDSFAQLGQGYIGPVPIPVIVLVVMAVIVALFLAHHVWGTYVYSIGGNETAASLTGLPVGRVKVFVYVMSGLTSGLAGVLVVSRLGVSAPTQAVGYELNVIAAAVIGGVSLQGGRGTILGAVLGAMIIGVLYNALVLLNVPTYWQQAFIGGIILLAAFIDRVRQRPT
jgi:ribose transport system permease protein